MNPKQQIANEIRDKVKELNKLIETATKDLNLKVMLRLDNSCIWTIVEVNKVEQTKQY